MTTTVNMESLDSCAKQLAFQDVEDVSSLKNHLSYINKQLSALSYVCNSLMEFQRSQSVFQLQETQSPFNLQNTPPAYKSPYATSPTLLTESLFDIGLKSQSGQSTPSRVKSSSSQELIERHDLATALPHFFGVIPAGGSGTRLWPLSRNSNPKFLLDLEGKGTTLLQGTVQRLNLLIPKQNILVVTGTAHQTKVSAQLPDIVPSNILYEPSPKDSMAALAFASAEIFQRDPDAVIASFPADHLINTEDEAFTTAVKKAYCIANESNRLVTIGLRPTFASTAFGYIHTEKALEGLDDAFVVESFKEKPHQELANEFFSQSTYVWNAGIFVCKARVILDNLQEHNKALYDGISAISKLRGNHNTSDTLSIAESKNLKEEIETVWSSLPEISIDHAVAEPVAAQGKMAVVCAHLDWKDVGDFASLAEIQSQENEVKVLGNTKYVQTTNSSGLFVPASNRLIACHGLDDIVIIDTPDALLVTRTTAAQEIKKLVNKCKKAHNFVS